MAAARESRMQQSDKQPIVYTRRFRGDELAQAREYAELLERLSREALVQAVLGDTAVRGAAAP